jgi:hypothetical protein
MAALTSDQYRQVFSDGQCGRTCLYVLKNVSAGDTFDVSTEFKVVKRGGIVSDTGTTIGAVTISGTVLTIPAGPAADGVWALVIGVSS